MGTKGEDTIHGNELILADKQPEISVGGAG